MESILVIKVKYGDTLRRFNALVNGNEQLALDMDGLRAKIISLFNFSPVAELTLTYVDEDGDVVTLVDDFDLCDVMRQRLKFLRIDVHLNGEKFVNSSARSSGSSTPMGTPCVQLPLPSFKTGVPEMLKSVAPEQEPPCEALPSPSIDFPKAASSSTMQFNIRKNKEGTKVHVQRPMRTLSVQHPLPSINTGVPEVLKSVVPEPPLEARPNLSIDFPSKAACFGTMKLRIRKNKEGSKVHIQC